MKHCWHCKKIIWPWQTRMLGITPVHVSCDIKEFRKSAERLFGIERTMEMEQLRRKQIATFF